MINDNYVEGSFIHNHQYVTYLFTQEILIIYLLQQNIIIGIFGVLSMLFNCIEVL